MSIPATCFITHDWILAVFNTDCIDGKCGECDYCTQEPGGMLQEIGGVIYTDAEIGRWIYEDSLVADDEPIREW
jgi:hypothetical protein